MKRLLLFVAPVIFLLASCKYDDSSLWDSLKKQESRIAAVEQMRLNIDGQARSLRSLVEALEDNDYITKVDVGSEGTTVTFASGKVVSVKNGHNGTNGTPGKDGDPGKDGTPGKDGVSVTTVPTIGARADEDGVMYWTIDGDWVLAEDGSKIPVGGEGKGKDGSDGITPKIEVRDGNWSVSFDQGQTWTVLGPASAGAPEDIFSEIVVSSDKVSFVLSDGTVIDLPYVNDTVKLQAIFDEAPLAYMKAGETVTIEYSLTIPSGATASFDSFEDSPWMVDIIPASETSGIISVTAPEVFTPTTIIFVLTDSYGNSFVKRVRVLRDPLDHDPYETEFIVDAAGGRLSTGYDAETMSIPGDASPWVSIVSMNGSIVLDIAPNDEEDDRTARITLIGNPDISSFTITQLAKDAIIVREKEITISADAQTVNIPVRANVAIGEVSSSQDWLGAVQTKAMQDYVFEFAAEENTSTEPRTAEITIQGADGVLSGSVTVIQEGAVIVLPEFAFSEVEASGIEKFAATLTASWTFESVTPEVQGFELDLADDFAEARTILSEDDPASDADSFSVNADELKDGTEYFFRPFIEVDGERLYGDTQTFTTLPRPEGELTIFSEGAQDLEEDSAVLMGQYYNASEKPDELGFEWGESYTASTFFRVLLDDIPEDMDAMFSYMLSGLEPTTTYYYRSYAKINGTVFTGKILSFTTKAHVEDTGGEESSQPGWLELPSIAADETFIDHSMTLGSVETRNYAFSWNENALVPNWVAYPLNAWNIGGNVKRTNNWGYDPKLPTYKQPLLRSGYKTGYARGHLCPSADRLYDDASNSMTFYYTNMTPMLQNGFNGAIWEDLEEKTRDWAKSCDTLYVIMGPVVEGSTEIVYDNNGKEVKVPVAFWKAVLRYDKSGRTGTQGYSACAFYLEHKDYGTKSKISATYSMSIDELEKKLGLDLFVNLPKLIGDADAAAVEAEKPSGVTLWW